MNEPRKIGFSMYILAAVVLISLLTMLFSGLLSHRNNPNKNPQTTTNADGERRLHLQRNAEGHYVATGLVNGTEAVFLLDTGATTIAIPMDQAERLSLIPGRRIATMTANGMTDAYMTTINSVQLGEITEYDLPAALVPNLPGSQILLGMSFLKRLDFSQRGDTLILQTQTR